MPPAGPILEVADVSVSFGGIKALREVSLGIEEGSISSLIGPNGAGKTTLFNCLSRIYAPSAGRIRFDGRDLLALRGAQIATLGIARTFQNLALFGQLSVEENVAIGAHSRGSAGVVASALGLPSACREEEAVRGEVRSILDFLGMAALAHRPVGSLPFGQQKRVELGRALAMRPRLLLLDEPAAGLNHGEVAALMDLVKEVRRSFALTVLLVEHHMGMVMGLSDRIVVLEFGRKIAEGRPDEIRGNQAVIDAYLGKA